MVSQKLMLACRFISPSRTPAEDALSPPRQGHTAVSRITVQIGGKTGSPESKKQLNYSNNTASTHASSIVQMSVHKPTGTMNPSKLRESPEKFTSSVERAVGHSPSKLRESPQKYSPRKSPGRSTNADEPTKKSVHDR